MQRDLHSDIQFVRSLLLNDQCHLVTKVYFGNPPRLAGHPPYALQLLEGVIQAEEGLPDTNLKTEVRRQLLHYLRAELPQHNV